jgi:hypothetical protein
MGKTNEVVLAVHVISVLFLQGIKLDLKSTEGL